MQHARRLVPLVLGVLLLAAPADAARAPAKCARAGSTTVAKNSLARVFEVDDGEPIPTRTLYGCLFQRGRSVKLADAYDDEFVLRSGTTRTTSAARPTARRATTRTTTA